MIVSISLEEALVHELDQLIQDRGYKGRSEVLRSALREFLDQQRVEGRLRGEVQAIVTLSYPERVERELSDIRHAHNDLIRNMLHSHDEAQRCTTILQCQGPDARIKRLLAELRGLRQLQSIKVHVV